MSDANVYQESQISTNIETEKKEEKSARGLLRETGFYQKPVIDNMDARFESDVAILQKFSNIRAAQKIVKDRFSSIEDDYVKSNTQTSIRTYVNYDEKADNKEQEKKKKRAKAARKKGLNESYNETSYMLNQIERDDTEISSYREDDEHHALALTYAKYGMGLEWSEGKGRKSKRFKDKNSALSESSKEWFKKNYNDGVNPKNQKKTLGVVKRAMLSFNFDATIFTPDYISKNIDTVNDKLNLIKSMKTLFGEGAKYRGELSDFEKQRMDILIQASDIAVRMYEKSLELMGITKSEKGYTIGKITNTDKENKTSELNELSEQLKEKYASKNTLIINQINTAADGFETDIKNQFNEEKQANLKAGIKENKSNLFDMVSATDRTMEYNKRIEKVINKNPEVFEEKKKIIEPLLKDLRETMELLDKATLRKTAIGFSGEANTKNDVDYTRIKAKMEDDAATAINVYQGKAQAITNYIALTLDSGLMKEFSYEDAAIFSLYYPDLVDETFIKNASMERQNEFNSFYGKETDIPEEFKDLSDDKLKNKVIEIKTFIDKLEDKITRIYSSKLSLDAIASELSFLGKDFLDYSMSKLGYLYNKIISDDAVAKGFFTNEEEKNVFAKNMKLLEYSCLCDRARQIQDHLKNTPQWGIDEILNVLSEEERDIVMESFDKVCQSPEKMKFYKKRMEVTDDESFAREFFRAKAIDLLGEEVKQNINKAKSYEKI